MGLQKIYYEQQRYVSIKMLFKCATLKDLKKIMTCTVQICDIFCVSEHHCLSVLAFSSLFWSYVNKPQSSCLKPPLEGDYSLNSASVDPRKDWICPWLCARWVNDFTSSMLVWRYFTMKLISCQLSRDHDALSEKKVQMLSLGEYLSKRYKNTSFRY